MGQGSSSLGTGLQKLTSYFWLWNVFSFLVHCEVRRHHHIFPMTRTLRSYKSKEFFALTSLFGQALDHCHTELANILSLPK